MRSEGLIQDQDTHTRPPCTQLSTAPREPRGASAEATAPICAAGDHRPGKRTPERLLELVKPVCEDQLLLHLWEDRLAPARRQLCLRSHS